jgi:hypothetical protein
MPPKLRKLLLPLLLEVSASPYLIADSIGMWHVGEERLWIPRFIFQRTQRMKRRINVGIFAGIHGDEPEAVLGLVDLVRAPTHVPKWGVTTGSSFIQCATRAGWSIALAAPGLVLI